MNNDYWMQSSNNPTHLTLFRVCIKQEGDNFPNQDHVRRYNFRHGKIIDRGVIDLEEARRKWYKRTMLGWKVIPYEEAENFALSLEDEINGA